MNEVVTERLFLQHKEKWHRLLQTGIIRKSESLYRQSPDALYQFFNFATVDDDRLQHKVHGASFK